MRTAAVCRWIAEPRSPPKRGMPTVGTQIRDAEPPRVLRGFTRELIRRGQTKLISLELRKRDISIWDVVKQDWVVPKGRFTVSVGASSRDIRQSTTFTV